MAEKDFHNSSAFTSLNINPQDKNSTKVAVTTVQPKQPPVQMLPPQSVVNNAPKKYPSTPKPSDSCTPEEAKKHALLACAAIVGGCEVAQKLVKKDHTALKHLSSQGCGLLEAKLRGNDYGIDDALINALKTAGNKLADDILEDDGASESLKMIARAGKTYLTFDKINSFQECRQDVEIKCASNYNRWLNSANQ